MRIKAQTATQWPAIPEFRFLNKDEPLLPSGLLGPVNLQGVE
jgi:hypothetical protein